MLVCRGAFHKSIYRQSCWLRPHSVQKKCFFFLLPPSTVYLAVLKSSWQNTRQILLWDGFKKASFYIQSCCGSYMHSYLQKSLPKILPGVDAMGFYVKENKGGTRKPIFKELWLNTFIIKNSTLKKYLADSENFASFKNNTF